jgi:hypothetical protein
MPLASIAASFRPAALAVALLLASCADPAQIAGSEPDRAPGTPQRESDELSRCFPPARTALRIDPGERALPLFDVVARLSAATGVVYSYDTPTEIALRKAVVQLSAPVRVEASEAYRWTEALLAQHGFRIAAVPGSEPPLATIGRVGFSPTLTSPLLVPSERVDFLREHPALLVTTTMSLPHVDVRTLGNSLRGITGNDRNGVVMPIANTSTILIQGDGAMVADLVVLLERVDALAAADLGIGTEEAVEKARAEAPKAR